MDVIENWHGTAGGYSNHKCRCELCRTEWNRYSQERKSTRRKTGYFLGSEVRHGSYVTYAQGCRCQECTSDSTRYTSARKRIAASAPEKPVDSICQCCGETRKLVLDHDHATGAFRGWICYGCNTGIGKLGDTVEGLQRAIRYLGDH